MDRYVHLYRDKWLKVAPERVPISYYDGELDEDGYMVEGYTFDFYEIVISDYCPGIWVGE